jgi:hypothetical protein
VSLKIRLILFAVGLALAAAIIVHTGVDTLVKHLLAVGWLLPPVVAVWGVVYSFSTQAWRIALAPMPRRPGFWRLWAISVSSFGLNVVTPVLGVGGEAYRAASLVPWIGRRHAVGAVVQYRLLHSLAHMLFVITALIPAALLLPFTPFAVAALGLMAAMGIVVGWFLHQRHQEGILEAGLDLLLAIPLIRRLARPLEGRREALRAMDARITIVYREHPGAFWRAVLVEYLSRWVMALELAFIMFALGLGVRPWEAIVALALSTTISNLFFYVPMELGAREGGLFLVFSLLGLGGEHGVFAAIVTRLRELVWTLIGLVLLWAGGGRLPEAASETSTLIP